jgi:tetratricopeptide (TPR) repeat protein
MSKHTIRLSILVCVLVLCAFAGDVAAGVQQNEARAIFARAAKLYEAGDIEGAIREYKTFLVLMPKVPEARSNLGAAYARLGRYQEAVEQYKQALALESRNTRVRFNLAVAYYKAAFFTEAAEELTRVIAEDLTNKNAVLLLANCRLLDGEYKKVIELLEPVEIAEPENLTVAYLLGTAYIHDNQPNKGQALIDRILRNGESAEARLMMGTARLMIRDFPGAITEFERAIQLNPDLPTLRALYGKALLNQGDRERAAKAFQEELAKNPNDFESNLYLGLSLKEDQSHEEALKYFQRAASLRPRDLNVSYNIATVKLAMGETVEAQQILERVVKEAPKFVEAHVSLATAYYRLKRKADGDRQRVIIEKLNAERQAEAPGAKEGLGPAYRGERPNTEPVKKPDPKPQQ